MSVDDRLRWQCRRGMLELDLLLEKFLERGYPALSTQEQADFAALLRCADQDLFDYFFGQRLPEAVNLAHVVEKIRHAADAGA